VRLPGHRDEARDRGPTARDDDLLSTLHTLEQPGQGVLASCTVTGIAVDFLITKQS